MEEEQLLRIRNVELFIKLVEGNSLRQAASKSNSASKHAANLAWGLTNNFGLLSVLSKDNHDYSYVPTRKGEIVYQSLRRIKALLNKQNELDNYINTADSATIA
jgi:hypothetical protein